MAVTVYSFSHRTSALNALKSVESFFERNNASTVEGLIIPPCFSTNDARYLRS